MDQNPNSEPEIPSLAELRKWGFGFPLQSQTSTQEWHQVDRGHQRKVYRSHNQEVRWAYMPKVLEGETLKSIAEIAALKDKRTLEELTEQAEAALKQLLARAHSGDERAVLLYASTVRRSVFSLERLAGQQPDKVQTVAEKHPRWPVLLSLNPQDIKRAKAELRRLHLGRKCDTPTRSDQRLDPHNFWTLLAKRALNVCQINKVLVPSFEAHSEGAVRERKTLKFWGAPVGATYYSLPNGFEVIIITDWQKQCVNLPDQITTADFDDWWRVIKACVLQYWHNPGGNYAEALKQVGQREEDECRRRSMAMDRVKQALRSLTDLH